MGWPLALVFPDEVVPHWFSLTSKEVETVPAPAYVRWIRLKIKKRVNFHFSLLKVVIFMHHKISLSTYLKMDTVRIWIVSFWKYNAKKWPIKVNIHTNVCFLALNLYVGNFGRITCRRQWPSLCRWWWPTRILEKYIERCWNKSFVFGCKT